MTISMIMDGTNDDLVLTKPFSGALGSAVDVFAEEISYVSWTMTGASPNVIVSDHGVAAASSLFRTLAESIWAPGKISIATEMVAYTSDAPSGLGFRLLIGTIGQEGETLLDAFAIRAVTEATFSRPSCPYSIARLDPAHVLELDDAELAHTAIIRQREVTLDFGDESLDVLSRWRTTIDPWTAVARIALQHPNVPQRVRVTLLGTQLDVRDHLQLVNALERTVELRSRNLSRPDYESQLHRAGTTLADLRASFSSPLLAAE